MPSIIDLHVHTTLGSYDSMITPQRLAEAAQRAGLTALAISEHLTPWPRERAQQFYQETGILALPAREWSTDMGHIIALGLEAATGIRTAEELRRAAEAEGAFLVLAHPFRYFPGPSSLLFGGVANAGELPIEELARHPVFALVDAIEVLNGGCVDRENELALRVARYLGKPIVGASDAHAPMEVGHYATLFEAEVRGLDDLLRELRAGRFLPARRVQGGYLPLDGAP
jgi:predicted metal-dependent phosphoesterase TrpH